MHVRAALIEWRTRRIIGNRCEVLSPATKSPWVGLSGGGLTTWGAASLPVARPSMGRSRLRLTRVALSDGSIRGREIGEGFGP
jgi:hypothetical protein